MPSIPKFLGTKIYKTGQTRGADDDVIFQNRVLRNSTALIPYASWNVASVPPAGESNFEKGFIALIPPRTYFASPNINQELSARGLEIGKNALIFYETRADWREFNPDELGWTPASSRRAPLGGQYVARVPATTATEEADKISRGFVTGSSKGAGIRVYEYAGSQTLIKCRLQLEALVWLCFDSDKILQSQGMSAEDVAARRASNTELCRNDQLLSLDELVANRVLSKNGRTMCPLCLEEISALGFFTMVEQAEGRAVPDLTVTSLNLFHVEELRIGRYGHRPYNVGWGHHHCNVVVKDSGIDPTLQWMEGVIDKNRAAGYLPPTDSGG